MTTEQRYTRTREVLGQMQLTNARQKSLRQFVIEFAGDKRGIRTTQAQCFVEWARNYEAAVGSLFNAQFDLLMALGDSTKSPDELAAADEKVRVKAEELRSTLVFFDRERVEWARRLELRGVTFARPQRRLARGLEIEECWKSAFPGGISPRRYY